MAHDYRPVHEYWPTWWWEYEALRAKQRRRRRAYLVIILLLLLAALLASCVQVSGVDVGGQKQAVVITQLQPYREARLFRTVVLFAPERAPILIAAHQLGYRIDRGTTAPHAYNAGHGGSGSVRYRVVAQGSVLLHGTEVPVVQSVNQRVLRHYLSTLARVMNRKSRPGIAGRALDVAAVQRSLTSLLLSPAGPVRVHLPFSRIRALPLPTAVHHHTVVHYDTPTTTYYYDTPTTTYYYYYSY